LHHFHRKKAQLKVSQEAIVITKMFVETVGRQSTAGELLALPRLLDIGRELIAPPQESAFWPFEPQT